MHTLDLFSAIGWDPFIRGVLIVAVAVTVLCGSVYLLLATNLGTRVGFMAAIAGLSGWILLMSIVWAVFGIGDQGRTPSWKLDEIVTGDIAQATTVGDYPQAFEQLKAGEPELGDAQSEADKVLASSAAGGGEGGGSASRFTPPFSTPEDYIQVGVWRKDPTTVWHIRKHKITPYGHDKHVDVVAVRPVVKQPPNPDGTPVKPVADLSKPVTYVVMTRDLGSVRQPPLFIGTAALIVFGVTTFTLHRRDQEIRAARETAAAG